MAAYPDVLFETCASGGNRFDLGMLSYMPQGWISDMCDPIGRLAIIGGASYLFPLDVMAAYIGPSPNHQNGRLSSIRTRFLAGVFCAARGVSLNEADIAAHQDEITAWMAFARETKADMVGGRFDRVKTRDNAVAWQYMSRDGQTVYLVYVHILSAPNMPAQRVYLVGLDPTVDYQLADGDEIYRGDALMQSGLPMPRVSINEAAPEVHSMPEGDFSAHLFVLRAI